MTATPTITLNDGHALPQIGFGMWQVPADSAGEAVRSALHAGYRLIDGAHLYGNEAGMGEGLHSSGLPREEVFLTTKVWNSDHGRERTRISVERSLLTIGVDWLDLVLIHWPVPSRDLYVETWQTLIDLQNEGLVRSIGVSNFNADHLERIIAETGVVPVLNQIEVSPKLQQPELRAVNARHDIVTQAWTPLGGGRSFDAEPITAAAARTGKSPPQVILRWHIQSGNAPIPRSVKPARQAENLDVFDFDLSDAEMEAIASLDTGQRTGPDPSVFKMM
ncbi:aldo/keto reductase [Tropicimonas isoalkanivorans]|uniref:2,5-diketo-D-gluconate reductase A n=1 Tax=Tropicimonas isoalkanivorans TaxID=441112 RepID=A0A1I1JPZ6_9RHOB|nr:aldo/keto reductase [Tropicimonas isoalkanivorans]SFC50261.1 2,5-diketo-D-gluconate reductase A [Tropicimonas isoalkanivorans]